MAIFFLNILLLLVWKALLLDSGLRGGKKAFCIIAGAQWFLIMALRAHDVGGDALRYEQLYQISELYGVGQTLQNLVQCYMGGFDGLDPGFDLLVYKPAQVLGLGYQFALATQALFVVVPLAHFIYRHSRDCFLSFTIFGSIFLGVIGLAGLRQSTAMALVVFIGYDLILGRRLVPFILLIVACYSIHASAIIFLPFYFLVRVRLDTLKTTFLVFLISALVPLAGVLAPGLYSLIGYEDYAYSYVGGNTAVYTAMFVFMAIFVVAKLRAIRDLDEEANGVVIALFLVLSALPFAFVNSNTMRAAWYYMLFLMLLVPYLVESFGREVRPLLYVGVIAVCLVALVFTGDLVLPDGGYTFFWE